MGGHIKKAIGRYQVASDAYFLASDWQCVAQELKISIKHYEKERDTKSK